MLRADGSLTEEAELVTGERIKLEGTWTHDHFFIVRKPCLRIIEKGVDGQFDVCSSPVSGLGSRSVVIEIDPDGPLEYRKIAE